MWLPVAVGIVPVVFQTGFLIRKWPQIEFWHLNSSLKSQYLRRTQFVNWTQRIRVDKYKFDGARREFRNHT